jgi:hypothetical protein
MIFISIHGDTTSASSDSGDAPGDGEFVKKSSPARGSGCAHMRRPNPMMRKKSTTMVVQSLPPNNFLISGC